MPKREVCQRLGFTDNDQVHDENENGKCHSSQLYQCLPSFTTNPWLALSVGVRRALARWEKSLAKGAGKGIAHGGRRRKEKVENETERRLSEVGKRGGAASRHLMASFSSSTTLTSTWKERAKRKGGKYTETGDQLRTRVHWVCRYIRPSTNTAKTPSHEAEPPQR